MGGGTYKRPFDGRIPFTTPTGGQGSVALYTRCAWDGSVAEAAVLRVRFAPT